jgi:L-iditol 2-dehydrogenase
MNAAFLKSIGCFEMGEMELRELKDDEVLIRVMSAGICGSDVHFYKDGRIGPTKATFPYIIGHECSGVIEDIGDKVEIALKGQRVAVEPAIYCYNCRFCRSGNYNICPNVKFLGTPPVFGAFSEYIIMPKKNITPIPEIVSYDEAIMLEPLTIGFHALERIDKDKLKTAKDIAIIGAGPIGLTILSILKDKTLANIIVIDKLDYRLKKAKELGADEVYNSDNIDYVKAIEEKTGFGVDIAIEAAGDTEAMYNASEISAPGATVLIAGIPENDNIEVNAHNTRRKELDIKLLRRSNFNEKEALEHLLKYRKEMNSIITHRFPLEDIQKGFEIIKDYKDNAIKIIINP